MTSLTAIQMGRRCVSVCVCVCVCVCVHVCALGTGDEGWGRPDTVHLNKTHALLTASAKLCWLEHGQPQPLLSHQPTWRDLMVVSNTHQAYKTVNGALCRTTFSDAQICNCINPFPAQWTSYDVNERIFPIYLDDSVQQLA